MPNPNNPVFAKAAILQVLQEGEGYGAEIVNRIRSRTSGSIRLSAGAVYPLLRSLSEAGLVRAVATSGHLAYVTTKKGTRTSEQQKKIVASLFGLTP